MQITARQRSVWLIAKKADRRYSSGIKQPKCPGSAPHAPGPDRLTKEAAMLKRIGLTLLLATLALAATAQAKRCAWHRSGCDRIARPTLPPHDSDPIATAMAAASAYWNGTPCGGAVRVEAEAGTDVETATKSPYGALASFMTPAGANLVSQPPSTYTGCLVRLSQAWRVSWAWDDQEYELLCVLMIHEYGHFEGYADEGAKPGTVAYIHPETAPLPPQCKHFRLVYYEHGVAPAIYEYEPGAWEPHGG